jgi:hypothetical protein
MADPTAFLHLLNGYRVTQALYAAAKLGVADQLKDGPRRSEELARATGAHAPSLHRLLRALASIGVLAEAADGGFSLTPIGECLRSDVPQSMRGGAIFYGDRRHWGAWGQLADCVRTGDRTTGAGKLNFLEMAARDPEGAAIFNDGMTSLTGAVDAAVVSAYDFSRFRKIADVGGGHGALLASILRANPALHGVLFDIPPVIEGARRRVEAAGLADRCDLVGGSFFESIPGGCDAYLLKWIIHDWDDERSAAILARCRQAMGNDAKLLLIERVVPERMDETPTTQGIMLADLNMLVLTGGRERTAAEYRALLDGAGLQIVRIVPTASAMSVIEGVPD